MLGEEGLGGVVAAGDEGVELPDLDAVLAAAADLDGAQLLIAHQGVGLRGGDVQDLGHLGEGQEPAFHVINKADTCGFENPLFPEVTATLGLGAPILISALLLKGMDMLGTIIEPFYKMNEAHQMIQDWSVEDAAAQGDEEALSKLMKDVDAGPRSAKVVKLDKEDRDVIECESGFEVRR